MCVSIMELDGCQETALSVSDFRDSKPKAHSSEGSLLHIMRLFPPKLENNGSHKNIYMYTLTFKMLDSASMLLELL